MSIVRSGYRDAAPALLRSQGDGDIISNAGAVAGAAVKSNIESQYQKQSDFFDIQKQETDDLVKMIDGLEGKDYEAMMVEITKARDEFADIFRGKSMRDYNTAGFQAQLFNKKKELANLKNTITTSKSKFLEAIDATERTPFFRREDAKRWIASQANLPPSQRESNPLAFILSDPQFRNAPEYILEWAKKQGVNSTYITDKKTGLITGNEAKNYKALYDEKGKFVMADEEIDRQLAENPWLVGVIKDFKRTPEQNKIIEGGGFDGTAQEDLRQGFKEYVQSIKALENWTEKGRMMQESRGGGTAYDRKEAADDVSVSNLQKRLLSGDADSVGILKEIEGVDTVIGNITGIRAVKQPDGKVRFRYNITKKTPPKRGVEQPPTVESREYDVTIDPNNKEQVSQVYSWFKNNSKAKDTGITESAGDAGTTGGSGLNWK